MKDLSACPVCEHSSFHHSYAHQERSTGKLWNVVVCNSCHLGFINPQPNWEELSSYYAVTYSPYQASRHELEEYEQIKEQARISGELRFAPIKDGTRLLDVGCGGGTFLKLASELGALVQGVEPSAYATQIATEQGFKVFNGTMPQFVETFHHHQFDVITANHVLEHTPDPVATLLSIKQVLAPDGVAVISVPNADYWACSSLKGKWHSTDIPRHLLQFNAKSLATCVAESGLQLQSLTTYSLSSAVAQSIREWLRFRLFIPYRFLKSVKLIDNIGLELGLFLDRRQIGEALIAKLTV